MKILIISNLYPPAFLGGYELGCSHMAHALRDAGHEVRVLTSTSIDGARHDPDVMRALEIAPIYNDAQSASLHHSVQQYAHIRSSWLNGRNLQTLSTVLAEFKPDVVYLWNLLGIGGLGVLALLRHLRTPWVWHIMDVIPRQLCALGGDPLPRVVDTYSQHVDGTYIVCSNHVHAELRQANLELGPRVHLVPNWVTHDGKPRRADYYSGGHIRLMHAVGVFGEHKGTDIVIEAAARLHELGYANFTIDMYGHPPSPRFLRQLHEHDVADSIKFRGPRDQAALYELYPHYDLFLFPTAPREPFGFAPLEAASFGCVPLIPYDCGISEWLVHDVHCLKTRRDAADLSQRIIEVIRGDTPLAPIGNRAQSVICRDFHIDRITPDVIQILETAARDRSSESPSPPDDLNALLHFAEGLLPTLVAEAT